jgi:hypothetical protein
LLAAILEKTEEKRFFFEKKAALGVRQAKSFYVLDGRWVDSG